jgi:hypothetical protein
MSFKKRLLQIYAEYDLNPTSLSERLKYKASEKISRLTRNEKYLPSFHILEDILISFKEINARWLITGEGNLKDVILPELDEKTEDRYIKLLEKTNEQQGRTIEIHEKCIEDLRSLNGGKKNVSSE